MRVECSENTCSRAPHLFLLSPERMRRRERRPSARVDCRRFSISPRSIRAFGTTSFMRVLFIEGTGIISTACTDLAISRGIQLTLLNRGRRISAIPAGARIVAADIDDLAAVSRALAGDSFDA